MHPPKIFISATSGDLRSIRQIVKEALLTINCHPVEQTNFEPDARTVENMLRGKIGDCQALIHICGMRYGAEPDVATLPPGTPRRSYTQWEYHIGRQLQEERGDDHFRVYTFICPEDFPYDPELNTESQEKRDLQQAHRSRLFDDPHLREKPRDGDDLKLRVLALQEQVFALKHEQAEVKAEVLKNRHIGLKAFAFVLLLLGGIYGGMHFLQRSQTDIVTGQNEIIANQKQPLDAPTLRARLTESSERTLQQELATADKAEKSADRQRLREAAEAAHAARLSRIDDLATRLSELFASGEASPILVEMLRILDTESVDAALAYEEKQRPSLIQGIKAAKQMDRERDRLKLQPVLKAAQFQATKGDSTAARASYKEILTLEPDWPEALDAFGWFLFGVSVQSTYHGSQSAGLADAEAMLTLATHRQSLSLEDPYALRLLSGALEQTADVLNLRRQSGDAEIALSHLQRSLEIREKLLIAKPDSYQAAQEVSLSHIKLGDFLATRGQPGDAEKNLAHFQRSLEIREKLLTGNPNSAQTARDASVSMERLGDFLARRGQSGDTAKALSHFQRSLGIREKLFAATPDSAQAARDLFVSLIQVGGFLTKRSMPGDAEMALSYFQRSLEISEKVLSANPNSAFAANDVCFSLDRLGSFFSSRGQSGDAEKAGAYFQRELDITEKLLTTNPDSADASRAVSKSMMQLGEFLGSSGQNVNKEKALTLLEHSLEILEKLLAANPDSAQPARDVYVNLMKLGYFLSSRAQSGDTQKALTYFQRGLEISEKILTSNPDSASAAHDVVASHYVMAVFAGRRGDAEEETKHRRACYDILAPRIGRGMTFDQTTIRAFGELKREFGGE